MPAPTADEQDPATMALRLRVLEEQNKEIQAVINDNRGAVHQAFVHVDMHTQVVQRVLHDIVGGAYNPGDVLDLADYYADYKVLYEHLLGEARDIAVSAWAKGSSVDSLLMPAAVADEKIEPPKDEPDSGYETEHFGGDYGKNTDEPIETSSSQGG